VLLRPERAHSTLEAALLLRLEAEGAAERGAVAKGEGRSPYTERGCVRTSKRFYAQHRGAYQLLCPTSRGLPKLL
jgi:hypothetical protein